MNVLIISNNNDSKYFEQLLLAKESLGNYEIIFHILAKELDLDFLIKNDIKLVISNQPNLEIVYFLKGLGIVTVIFGDEEIYFQKADLVIDCFSNKLLSYYSGDNFSMSNDSFDILNVIEVIKLLNWDSDFFGFPISLLNVKYLTINIQKLVDSFVVKNNIRLVQYLCNCHDDKSVYVAEKNGYHFCDIRLTFQLSLNKFSKFEVLDDSVKLATEGDLPYLIKMTENLYKNSRYFFDGNFELNKVNDFYSKWISGAVFGTFDDECYALYQFEKPIAFCTIRYSSLNKAHIGLFGVDVNFIGKGFGKKLINTVISILKCKDIVIVEVVTQGRNYGAQRLYQSAGFVTKETELWYHKWH